MVKTENELNSWMRENWLKEWCLRNRRCLDVSGTWMTLIELRCLCALRQAIRQGVVA